MEAGWHVRYRRAMKGARPGGAALKHDPRTWIMLQVPVGEQFHPLADRFTIQRKWILL
jgi:hypothetical protein